MKKNEIKVLESLIRGSKTLKELAWDLSLSESYVSEITDELCERNFIRKERKGRIVSISLAKPKDIYFKKLSDSFSLRLLLSGKKDLLLPRLLKPKRIIDFESGISKSQVYKDISELRSIGVVLKKDGKYYVNPMLDDLINLLEIINKEFLYKGANEYAIVLWRKGNERLEKIPKGFGIEGEFTAFSIFRRYGVDYTPAHNYVFYPRKKLLAGEIFIHSLIASETKTQRSMCVIFYLKNREKLDIGTIKKLAKHYDALNLYVDVEYYLATKKEYKFLPWNEFSEKAKLYGAGLEEYFGEEKLLSVLAEIGKIIEEEINIYLIGGGNMIIQGIKDSTKDIDLIIESTEDFYALTEVLEDLGYRESSKVMGLYKNLQPSTIMYKENNPRFDIFVKTVCGVIELSKSMKSNALFFKNFGKVTVHLISQEGIFIFKSITDREGDLEDVGAIAKKHSLNWKWIFEEVIIQERKSKKRFSFAVLDTLEVLEDRYGIVSPITKKLRYHCLEEAIIIALDKPKNRGELKKLIDFPMSQIDNAIRRLEKRQMIMVDRSKRPATISKGS